MTEKRDNYTRCKWCKQLFKDPEYPTEEEKRDGYKCPNGCQEPFTQPAYESPLSS